MRLLDRVAETNYTLYKQVGLLKLRIRDIRSGGRDPLLVYQMGKVGSTSVVRSLRSSGLRGQIYHIHTLTSSGISGYESLYERLFPDLRQIHSHLLESIYLRPQVESGKARRWRVVTLVRDPVARNVSAFFQTMYFRHPELYEMIEAGSQDPAQMVPRIIDAFFDEFPHDGPLEWFDNELRSVFGFDVFAEEFPRHRGYARYSRDGLDVLVMRLEDLGDCFAEAFEEFLGIEGVAPRRVNEAVGKPYADAYREFVNNITFSDRYLDRMYDSRFVSHFYTPEEIRVFRDSWSESGPVDRRLSVFEAD